MALRTRHVRIESPCPVDDLPADRAAGPRSWHCGHCEKSVHVLSAMTETEARAFLTARAGESLCVSYAVRPDGTIRFRPEPPKIVPATALVARRRLAVAAVGLQVALAACAPHDNPAVERAAPVVADRLPEPSASRPTIPDARAPGVQVPPPPAPVPDEVMMDGEIAVAPPPEDDTVVDGGLKVEPPPPEAAPEEPCDPPSPKLQMRRGGLRAMPVR